MPAPSDWREMWQSGPGPLHPQALDYAVQIAQGLAAAHEKGIENQTKAQVAKAAKRR